MSRSALFDSEPKKRVSNADRIRKMTDEQLAAWFARYIECRDCPQKGKNGLRGCDKDDCLSGAREWLKQEVTQDADK